MVRWQFRLVVNVEDGYAMSAGGGVERSVIALAQAEKAVRQRWIYASVAGGGDVGRDIFWGPIRFSVRFISSTSMMALAACAVAAVAALAALLPGPATPAAGAFGEELGCAVEGGYARRAEEQIAALIDEARGREGPAPLRWSSVQASVARMRATDMAVGRYFAHYNGQGVGAELMMRSMETREFVVGENIGRTNYRVERAVSLLHDGFMASAPHRANVLHTGFSQAGVGIASSDGVCYVAVVFTD